VVEKSPDAYRTIGEVAALIGEPTHVIRFWETKVAQIRPGLRSGGRRRYRAEDVRLLKAVRALIRDRGVTLDGVAAMFREGGRDAVYAASGGHWPTVERGDYRKTKIIAELEAAKAILAPFT